MLAIVFRKAVFMSVLALKSSGSRPFMTTADATVTDVSYSVGMGDGFGDGLAVSPGGRLTGAVVGRGVGAGIGTAVGAADGSGCSL